MDACLDYFEDDGDGAINLRDRILALADEKEATAARLAERERELGEARAYPDEMDRCARIIWRTRDPEGVAEYERIGCGEPGAAWINGRLGGLVDSLRSERDALKEKLAAAERVVGAVKWCVADAAFKAPEQITPESLRWIDRLRYALAAYDALSRS